MKKLTKEIWIEENLPQFMDLGYRIYCCLEEPPFCDSKWYVGSKLFLTQLAEVPFLRRWVEPEGFKGFYMAPDKVSIYCKYKGEEKEPYHVATVWINK